MTAFVAAGIFYYIFNPYGDKKAKDFDNCEDYKSDIMPPPIAIISSFLVKLLANK